MTDPGSGEQWIVIPRWEDFQHRDSARSQIPPWIKVHTEIDSKDDYLALSFHLRGVLLGLWVEYATGKRQLRDSTLSLTRRLGQRVARRDLQRLNDAGFIELSASRPASEPASRPASLDLEVEKKDLYLARPLQKPAVRNGRFPCPVCGIVWKSEQRLTEHVELVHG